MILKTLNNSQPHSSWGGWDKFLATCEVRAAISTPDGDVIYYGKTNCNYIVMPNGYIVENYAFHGHNFMWRIREAGWRKVWDKVRAAHAELNELIGSLRKAV